MGILTTKAITNVAGSIHVPIKELVPRVIQRHEATYTGGEWNPDNTSNWAPGSFVDFTPRRADSTISYIWRVPHSYSNNTHAISHWRFFVNGVLYYWHSVSGVHIQDGCTIKWEIPSWGTSAGRIGYQIRSYSNDVHETRLYRTFFWDGTTSTQNCFGQLIVEEYASVGAAPNASQQAFTAG